MTATAIIVAAGQGTRAGNGPPKQLRRVAGQPALVWSLNAFHTHPGISAVILVTSQDVLTAIGNSIDLTDTLIAPGGATRAASVASGVSACVADAASTVLIHDAARPGLTHAMIDALLDGVQATGAAAPALAVTDALKRRHGAQLSNVSREGLFRVQTPQAFRLGDIRAALAAAPDTIVDDLQAIEALGIDVTLVPGDPRLMKLTYPEDFAVADRLLSPPPAPRIGKGFDVHAFEPGDHVTLCGVKIPHSAKLKGHSDADAAWHALTDAILGAAALGDIGDHFPPSDERWKNADSAVFLTEAIRLIAADGYTLTSCDITVICEAPKIKPRRETMRARTADITGLPISAISVKATTTETLGFTGRGEGIAAEAVAVLMPKP